MTVDRSTTVDIVSLDFKKPFVVVWLQRPVFETGVAGRILLAKSGTECRRQVKSSFGFGVNHVGSDPLQ